MCLFCYMSKWENKVTVSFFFSFFFFFFFVCSLSVFCQKAHDERSLHELRRSKKADILCWNLELFIELSLLWQSSWRRAWRVRVFNGIPISSFEPPARPIQLWCRIPGEKPRPTQLHPSPILRRLTGALLSLDGDRRPLPFGESWKLCCNYFEGVQYFEKKKKN